MSFLDEAIFPDTLAFGATGGPEYATTLVEMPSGEEQRRSRWTYPRHRYQLSLAPRTVAETAALFAFFHAVAKGRAYGFRFLDPGAGQSTGTLEPIGTGTGSEETYQLIKRYTSLATTFDRVISKPVAGTVRIFVSGIETTSFTVDTATGLVTLTAAGSAPITATFQFHVPVRFVTDTLAIRRIDGGCLWEQIELVEVRDLDATADDVTEVMGLEDLPLLYEAGWDYDLTGALESVYTSLFDY